MSPISRVAIGFLAVAWIDASIAFAPVSVSHDTSSSVLHLVPEQGRQLVAYSQAALVKKAKESASKASNLTSDRRRAESSSDAGLARARNMMTRLLHLTPSNAGDQESHEDREKMLQEQLTSFYQGEEDLN
jgi:hypothetical protein